MYALNVMTINMRMYPRQACTICTMLSKTRGRILKKNEYRHYTFISRKYIHVPRLFTHVRTIIQKHVLKTVVPHAWKAFDLELESLPFLPCAASWSSFCTGAGRLCPGVLGTHLVGTRAGGGLHAAGEGALTRDNRVLTTRSPSSPMASRDTPMHKHMNAAQRTYSSVIGKTPLQIYVMYKYILIQAGFVKMTYFIP